MGRIEMIEAGDTFGDLEVMARGTRETRDGKNESGSNLSAAAKRLE